MSALDPRIANPRVIAFSDGCTERIRYGAKEAAEQTFKAGQFIYLNNGAVTGAASDGMIDGIALVDATNAANQAPKKEIPFIELYADDVIAIQVTNNGTPTPNTTPVPNRRYGLYVASNVCYLDVNDTENLRFLFMEPLDIGGEQTNGYWCKARVLPSALPTRPGE